MNLFLDTNIVSRLCPGACYIKMQNVDEIPHKFQDEVKNQLFEYIFRLDGIVLHNIVMLELHNKNTIYQKFIEKMGNEFNLLLIDEGRIKSFSENIPSHDSEVFIEASKSASLSDIMAIKIIKCLEKSLEVNIVGVASLDEIKRSIEDSLKIFDKNTNSYLDNASKHAFGTRKNRSFIMYLFMLFCKIGGCEKNKFPIEENIRNIVSDFNLIYSAVESNGVIISGDKGLCKKAGFIFREFNIGSKAVYFNIDKEILKLWKGSKENVV